MDLVTGIITIWSGSIGSIPGGWALCDGNNGTPDLRDSFIVGAGSSYNPADTGGAATHNHGFTSNGHTHTLTGTGALGAGAVRSQTSLSSNVAGTTNNGSSLPEYYALAYIMFL